MKLNKSRYEEPVDTELTYSHRLYSADHQAIVDLAFDPLCELLIFLCVLGHMYQQLRKCVATDGEGMDKQWAGHKTFTVEQLQQPFPIFQTPARPDEVLHLV